MGKRILVVDDKMFLRYLLKDILEEAGHQVIGEAEDGEECLMKYKSLKPDLVTLDITMPNMTGLEALRKLMEIDSNAKVLMVSAMAQKTMVLDAITHGAKGFIAKPFKNDKVIEAINGIDKENTGTA